MSGKTVHIKSFGCQMNKLDTTLVNSALKDSGFALTDRVKEADVVLINTCSVREHAEQRVISHLGHLQHIKKSRPDIVVGVIGCMAQRLGNKLLQHDAVDIVCGPAQIPQLTKLITQTLKQNQETISVTEKIRKGTDESQALALEDFESAYGTHDKQIPGQAYVRIMRGCDNFCSYCIVPYVRGPEVSRPPEAIIEQIKKLAEAGIKQVTLIGQKANSYKYKSGDKTYCLADLLRTACDIEGIEWIRFVTSYPSEKFFEEILQAMADLPKVCNYLHMPAQSGSDKILRAMNRHYTAAQYLEMLYKARDIVSEIAIAGDFIVGFPGETDNDFEATVDLVKKARYKNCFIFKYSPRHDTIADKRLADDIPLEVKKKRNIDLLAIQEEISGQLSAEYLDKKVKVLVEGLSKKPHLDSAQSNGNPQLIGRTETDYIVVFNGSQSLSGQFAQVKITKTSPLTLFARLM
ncbi:MAG: tRNA (N6-isopentenyl adenosine(37)-C2)-methylthiotransferase MiaB [Phycisphaerae bacterium]|nr:tRNA (N6-isopentenyl adenosine(37)-C2)-methylthiotransferase MiaB [Phycisphaerae bacterium]NIP53251.1 tRNA (N6-isopentenyl adenosine(37)-C2)-methylthiotransferase MiaB [Phycisphaerae bacterium]NIS52278.1 tRNA (N6-isopentenyl adenosine(37)-C2)-methylthiotransferase MiaB [Phycisphaerae bacterium]NIU09823.1 tRNA (N6-isopentenyl adenosine(37)-C2)-methylthiotransferase MiaB [Phycisphaerae bacterium]NIU59461.1 tRNA (N6-isopentenyl adenosine(37)-C2)-methylthiotransferase MiaB [Phycisphaerae bacteri